MYFLKYMNNVCTLFLLVAKKLMCSTRSSRFEASNDNKLAPCKNEPYKCICNTYRIIPVEFGHRKDFFSFFFFKMKYLNENTI